MKRYSRLATILMMTLLVACKKEVVESPYKYIIKGSCQYIEAVSGNIISNNSSISIKIKYKDNNEVLPVGFNSKITGNSYEFGPLKPGDYIITAEYLDNATSIFYIVEQLVTINNTSLIQDLTLKGSPNTLFIKGGVTYPDLFTNVQTSINSGLIAKLKCIDEVIQLPNNGDATVMANNFSIGPLISKKYELTLNFTDAYGLVYSKVDTLDLNSLTGPIIYKNYSLSRKPNTILIATITDSLNNSISNAKAFLYNNYNFLTQYKDNATTSIANGISNSQGKVVFTNLTAVPHFIYAAKIFGSDTLNSYDPSFNSNSQPSLISNQINYLQVIIK